VRVATAAIPSEPETAATSAPPPLVQPGVGMRDANRLLNVFSAAYESGNIDDMRAMFAKDMQGVNGDARETLAEYDRLFDSSSERKLSVRDVNWFADGDTLTIVASYHATVTQNKRQRRTQGNLRLDLRRDNDRWLIVRLKHDERPG
jgi:hypothetical protein